MMLHISKYRPLAGESAVSQTRAGGGRGNTLLGSVVLMLAVMLLSACSKVVTLQANLRDADANEIVMVLNQNGIEVDKQRDKEGVTLMVAENDLSRASSAMNAAGLPRRNPANLGEVFKRQGMISSPLEERVRYIYGLSEELGYTMQQFDHVISARVHVVLPERVAPGEPILPSSAAVFIKYRPPLDEDLVVPRIRNLVAASIPGLAGEEGRNKISVVMTPTELPPPSIEWTTVGPFKVQAESAGALKTTLAVLIVVILMVAGMILFQTLKSNKKFGAMLAKMKKAKPAKAAAGAGAGAGKPAMGNSRI